MKLISCEACEHKISPMAESCPNCGHPAKKKIFATPATPAQATTYTPPRIQCYSCPGEATKKCTNCGRNSCLLHVQPAHTKYGSTLLCTDCKKKNTIFTTVFFIIFVIVFLIILSQF